MKQVKLQELGRTQQDMFIMAAQARGNAYAPYSHYHVGAAIEAANGCIYRGCNVENAAYQGACAERNAVGAMVADGCAKVRRVMVVLRGAETPCGGCLQHIWQLCEGNRETEVILADPDAELVRVTTMGELFPHPFNFTA